MFYSALMLSETNISIFEQLVCSPIQMLAEFSVALVETQKELKASDTQRVHLVNINS